MTSMSIRLADLGWSNAFMQQIEPEERAELMPARVTAVHRSELEVIGESFEGRVPGLRDVTGEEQVAVGDWLMVDAASHAPKRILERHSLFRRKAAGTEQRVQVIAANIDTLFIVTSCNHDFNVARLERYLALAHEAEVTPVIVITKADLADDASAYTDAARRLGPGLLVECFDARDTGAVSVLAPWCVDGQTVALAGSSGVGKSTLVNTLIGGGTLTTAGIREHDSHGRHTTTARSMHRLAAGGWLIDTPGMRELQLTDASDGIDEVFADIVALAEQCRFSDCGHDTEPGCAVTAAIEAGALDPGRLARYRKLQREDRRNSEAIWEQRARSRAFGKMTKGIVEAKRARHEE